MSGVPPSTEAHNAEKQAAINSAAAGFKEKSKHFGPEWFQADMFQMPKVPNRQKGLDISAAQLTRANYLPDTSDLDRRMAAWFALPSDSNGPLGVKTQPTEMLLDYNEAKNAEGMYLRELQLAHMLVDPNDPSSQRLAFTLYPELQRLPEERSMAIAKFGLMLESMLRSGQVTSKEEVQLLLVILQPDTILPTSMTWVDLFADENGNAIVGSTKTAAGGTLDMTVSTNMKKATSFFDPTRYWQANVDFKKAAGDNGAWEDDAYPQGRIKIAIARKMFPGLRAATADDVVQFIKDNIVNATDGRGLIAALKKDELTPAQSKIAGSVGTSIRATLKDRFPGAEASWFGK